jgi:carbon-monoxide dehydrogenase large subunit
MLGPYRVPALFADVRSVVTNKAVSAPYRGAGRPEGAFVLNRVVDRVAEHVGKDPVELRRRLLIPPEELPYSPGVLFRDGSPMVLDSGDYPSLLNTCVEEIGYEDFRRQQQQERTSDRYLGIGVACNVESTGMGPFEGARVDIDSSGRVFIYSGLANSGQSHETTLAQVCATSLGVSLDHISVITGDTSTIPYGLGTYHSRTAVMAANAVHQASTTLRLKLLELAAHHLEVSPGDLELSDGSVRVRGVPDRSLSFANCAAISLYGGDLPNGMLPGLSETAYFQVSAATWASAAHAAIVEVDPGTGTVRILKYVVVHDCGKALNPMVVTGQILGGVAAGIGGALLEELVYSDDGQPLTTSMMDYLLPRFTDVPRIEVVLQEVPATTNPLGVRGAGEGGTIGPPAVLAAAVEDALRPLGARINSTPITHHAILDALRAAVLSGAE